MDKHLCNMKSTHPMGMNDCKIGMCEPKEPTVLENLERERDHLIERLKNNAEAIILLKDNPELNNTVRILMRAGAYQ